MGKQEKGNYGLALTLKVGDQILIGKDIVVTINKYTASQLRVSVKAPKEYAIDRRHRSAEGTDNESEKTIPEKS